MLSVGLDVHQKYVALCALDSNGKIVKEKGIRGGWDKVRDELVTLSDRLQVCFEASLGYGTWHARLSRIAARVVVAHPGDLTAWLVYDADHDGAWDAETPIEFYLARPGSCASSPMWGYSVVLDGRYYFQHEEEAAALDGWDVGSFTSFRGLNRGGSFYLRMVDAGDGGEGVVRSWAVHVR